MGALKKVVTAPVKFIFKLLPDHKSKGVFAVIVYRFFFDFIFAGIAWFCYRRLYWSFLFAGLRRKRDPQKKPRLLWGPVPVINNKYWSAAMEESGYYSKTVMAMYYGINSKQDFNLYFDDVVPYPKTYMARVLRPFRLMTWAVKNFDVFHFPFTGLFFKNTRFEMREAQVLKKAGCKLILITHGGDITRFSKLNDQSYHHAMLINYMNLHKHEEAIEKRIFYWLKYADASLTGIVHIEAMPRWDVLAPHYAVIDTKDWRAKDNYSSSDGVNNPVKIVHAPNHRYVKGTQYLLKAIEELKSEGLKVELLMLEKISNAEVKRIMIEEADILAEQFLLGYGLTAVEGMCVGLPTISNLDIEYVFRVMRRNSFLNECPILSATPESLKEQLRVLIRNPKLRMELGKAGRRFIEKYHSYQTAQYMFEKIYDKVWSNKEVDLLNMFDPYNKTAYNYLYPLVEHPLIDNKVQVEMSATV